MIELLTSRRIRTRCSADRAELASRGTAGVLLDFFSPTLLGFIIQILFTAIEGFYMSMSGLIQSRQPNRGSFIDLDIQAQLGMRRQNSERFYDTQMLSSSPLFVKLSGN